MFLLGLFVSMLNVVNAQTGYFKTYQDYLDNKMTEMKEKSIYFGHASEKLQIVFKDKDGKKVKMDGSEIWGFKFKGGLFRVGGLYHENFYKVISQGESIYYQNGPAHFEMLKYDKKEGTKFGFYNALSNDLNSDIVPFDHHMKKKFKKLRAEYLAKHPELKPVFDCMEEKAKKAQIDGTSCMEEYKKK